MINNSNNNYIFIYHSHTNTTSKHTTTLGNVLLKFNIYKNKMFKQLSQHLIIMYYVFK